VVQVAVGEQHRGRVQPVPRTAVVAKAPVAVDVPGVRTQSQRLAEGPFGPLDGRTGVTPERTAGSVITVDATRSGGLLFVHGDVFTRRAVGVLIVVTVADGRDRTLLIQSVVLPGGSTAFRLGPNDRFDLSVELPEAPTMQAETVTASAYDEAGAVIASAKARLDQLPIEAPAAYRM